MKKPIAIRPILRIIVIPLTLIFFAELLLSHQEKQRERQQAEITGMAQVFGSMKTYEAVRQAYERYELVYLPYLRWRGKPNQHTEVIKTNTLGFRSGEISQQKSADTIRIIVTGGSFAWGAFARSNETTLSGYLEKYLNERAQLEQVKKHVEVVNMAELGYVSTQEFLLWSTMLSFKPDLIIHFTGYNDAYTSYTGEPIRLKQRLFGESLFQLDKMHIVRFLFRRSITALFEQSSIYRWVRARQNQKTSQVNQLPTHNTSSLFLTNVRLIAELAQAEKVPVLVVLQPTLLTEKKQLSRGEEAILADLRKKDPAGIGSLKNSFYSYSQGLKQLAGVYGFEFLDGSDFFSGRTTQLYADPAHVTDEGFAIIADRLSQAIIGMLFRT